ncbi:MAG: TauD/TfdA family dioxygenase [Acidimicrobiales bacterium]
MHGIELATCTDDELAAVQLLLLEHHVVFFRDQQLDDEQHEAFARRWGDPIPSPVVAHLGGAQTMGVVFNDEDHPPDTDGEGWHTDHSWASYIPDVAILRAVTVPPVGGDTLWSDIEAAYRALSPAMQQFLAGLTARHDPGPRFELEMRARMPDELVDRALAAFPGIDHPVIMAHPVTGAPGVFVNPGYTRHINGVSRAESDHLLRYLFDLIGRPEFICRFRWDEGSVAIWDEHATVHRGPQDFGVARRELHRFTVGAGSPAPTAEVRRRLVGVGLVTDVANEGLERAFEGDEAQESTSPVRTSAIWRRARRMARMRSRTVDRARR